LGGRNPIENPSDLLGIGVAPALDQLVNEPIDRVAAQVTIRHVLNCTAHAHCGLVIAEGTLEAIAAKRGSITDVFLRPVLGLPAMASD
jgi:hypothetical protein